MKDADLTDVFAKLSAIQQVYKTKREQNRAWVEANMPEVARLFDELKAADMNPKLVSLEKFV